MQGSRVGAKNIFFLSRAFMGLLVCVDGVHVFIHGNRGQQVTSAARRGGASRGCQVFAVAGGIFS